MIPTPFNGSFGAVPSHKLLRIHMLVGSELNNWSSFRAQAKDMMFSVDPTLRNVAFSGGNTPTKIPQ